MWRLIVLFTIVDVADAGVYGPEPRPMAKLMNKVKYKGQAPIPSVWNIGGKKSAQMRPQEEPLYPIVHCRGRKWAQRLRTGKGFTWMELQEARIPIEDAIKLGITVDRRRFNKDQEGLERNVERLKLFVKAYKEKIGMKTGKDAPIPAARPSNVDNMVGKLIDRGLRISSQHGMDLDDTTFAKPDSSECP